MKPTILIIAGGLSTRMGTLTQLIPKCLLPINGKPMVQHQIEYFREQGFTDFVFCIAHMAQKVMDYFGDGSKLGVKIRYCVEEEGKLLGTAGAAKLAEKMVGGECVVCYGDVLAEVNLDSLLKFHGQKKSDFTVVVRESPSGAKVDCLITLQLDGRVSEFIEKPSEAQVQGHAGKRIFINNSVYVVSKKAFGLIPKGEKFDFASQLIPRMVSGGARVFGFVSRRFFVELGKPEKYEKFAKQAQGKQKLLDNGLKKAIFMDRDGVINSKLPDLPSGKEFERQFELANDEVAGAIRRINESGFLAIVSTNQPAVAKGMCTLQELESIHGKMKALLAEGGAKLDAIYFCPHHPQKGFPGEVAELKIKCECRKPKPGMLLDGAREFGIDLKSSWMVGDSLVDVAAGKAAGVKTVLVEGGGNQSRDEAELSKTGLKADLNAESLNDAVGKILAEQKGSKKSQG